MAGVMVKRRRHATQRGLTLIEIMVASVIVAIIALPLGAALAIAVRSLGPTSLQGNIASANNLLAIERQIGADMNHADCVIVAGSSSCPTGGSGSCAPGAVLCVAWFSCAPAPGGVSGASYLLTSGQVTRQAFSGPSLTIGESGDIKSFTAQAAGSPSTVKVTITTRVRSQNASLFIQPLPSPQTGDSCG